MEAGRTSDSGPTGQKWFTVSEEPSEIQEERSSLSHGASPRVWRLPRMQSLLGPTASPRLLGAHSPVSGVLEVDYLSPGSDTGDRWLDLKKELL